MVKMVIEVERSSGNRKSVMTGCGRRSTDNSRTGRKDFDKLY